MAARGAPHLGTAQVGRGAWGSLGAVCTSLLAVWPTQPGAWGPFFLVQGGRLIDRLVSKPLSDHKEFCVVERPNCTTMRAGFGEDPKTLQ